MYVLSLYIISCLKARAEAIPEKMPANNERARGRAAAAESSRCLSQGEWTVLTEKRSFYSPCFIISLILSQTEFGTVSSGGDEEDLRRADSDD